MQDDHSVVANSVKYQIRIALEGKHPNVRLIGRPADEGKVDECIERGGDMSANIVGARDAMREKIVPDIRKVFDRTRIEP
jgi:hypothetical protein